MLLILSCGVEAQERSHPEIALGAMGSNARQDDEVGRRNLEWGSEIEQGE